MTETTANAVPDHNEDAADTLRTGDLAPLWAALAAPFPEDEIELLPQNVAKYNKDAPRFNCIEGHPEFRKASKDGIACGGWHQWSIHLRYVGHAGITTRLNDVDPTWTWEPMAFTPVGTPLYQDGGMWIRLTVLGVTRLGFGDPGKNGLGTANGTKELIGDALRNAAMRFGVGTYLWSKSDKAKALQAGQVEDDPAPAGKPAAPAQPAQAMFDGSTADAHLGSAWNNVAELQHLGQSYQDKVTGTPEEFFNAIRRRIQELQTPAPAQHDGAQQ